MMVGLSSLVARGRRTWDPMRTSGTALRGLLDMHYKVVYCISYPSLTTLLESDPQDPSHLLLITTT